jgi:uncharacterized membrane protein
MNKALPEKRIRQIFRISLSLKGIHAIMEIIGGFILTIISPSQVSQFINWITRNKTPEDQFANYLLDFAANLTLSTLIFGAFYLLSHGILKLILVVALLKNRLWAYPWSLVLFTLFIVYQVYRYTYTFSVGLILLTIFDVIVIWLIWHEYRVMKKLR